MDPVPYLVAMLALGVLVVGPFFRGLFFPGEQLPALAVVAAAFLLFWVRAVGRGGGRPQRPVEWAGLAVAGCYWISTLVAVNPRAAVGEALKYSAYFMLLFMFARLAQREGWRLALSAALVAAGLGLAVLGLGAAAGTFSYRGAFEGGRLCSSLQYPNTAATYFTAAVILAGGLAGAAAGGGCGPDGAPRAPGWKHLAGCGMLAAGTAVMFLAFVFTLSRGGWVLFPFLLVLLAVALPAGQRAVTLAVLGAALLGGMAAVPGLGRVLAGPRGTAVWAYTALAFALGGVLGVAARLAVHLAQVTAARARVRASAAGGGRSGPGSRPALRLAAGVLVLLVAAAVVAAAVRPQAAAALVPAQVRGRLAAIRLSESGAQDRIHWTLDALRLVGTRPLLGAGGGGWNSLYGTVQTYAYFSTEVHNHYAQVWVETGTVGFFAFLALWAGLVLSYWRSRRVVRGPDGALVAAAFVAALGLGTHAVLDFNLSLPAVAATLWALMGVVAAAEPLRAARRRAEQVPWWAATGVGVAVLALLLLTVSLRVGYAAGQRGARELNAGRARAAAEQFERARRYDPWTASFAIDLGQAYDRLARQGEGSELYEKARVALRRGVELDPYNFQYRTLYGNFLFRRGDVEGALRELETALDCRPAVPSVYENLAAACVRAALLPQVEEDRARSYLERVEGVARRMTEYSALSPAFAGDRRLPPSTPRLVLARGEALLLLGDLEGARGELEQAAGHKDLKEEASLFLAALAHLTGGDPGPALAQVTSIPRAEEQARAIAARARALAASP